MDDNILSKTTEELENEIKSSKDIDTFIQNIEPDLLKMDLAEYLKRLLHKYDVDKSVIFSRCLMKETNYGYEIFNGKKKNVSRDKLIQLCFGFPLTLDEAKIVLRLGNVRPLYSRDERDAYIMFALNCGYTVEQIDAVLYERGLKTIL